MAGAGHDSAYVQPLAAWQVTLDGQDITSRFSPRLIRLRLNERRGEEADELEIELHDAAGDLVLPPEGARLSVALGWARGSGVEAGLVDKGQFTVDELTWSGPPDTITIRGRSADLKDTFRTRKSRSWKDTTLGDIVTKVAGEHGLQPRCHPDLADKPVTLAEQANKSDMQFLRDLGRRYDSTASPKAGCLIFAPVDATTTATGKPLPSLTITRQSGDSVSYRRAARERAQDGAEADWQDQDAAERRQVHAGGERKRKLKRVYASKADATEAAKAETNRLKRAEATLSLTLAHGNAAIAPGLSVRAQGFKAEIDKKPWRIASANHEMDATGGFRTSLELDVAG